MRQIRIPRILGLIQVELTNSFFYVGIINTVLTTVTLWAVAGPTVQVRWPWLTYWHFLGVGFIFYVLLLVFDWFVLYPARLRVINEQSCKHDNPAMEEIKKHTKWLKQISEHIGVELDD